MRGPTLGGRLLVCRTALIVLDRNRALGGTETHKKKKSEERERQMHVALYLLVILSSCFQSSIHAAVSAAQAKPVHALSKQSSDALQSTVQ